MDCKKTSKNFVNFRYNLSSKKVVAVFFTEVIDKEVKIKGSYISCGCDKYMKG